MSGELIAPVGSTESGTHGFADFLSAFYAANPKAATPAKGAAIAAPVTTGVVTPANAAYTAVDQTALANAVLSLASSVNAMRAALTAAGITS
jgi:hypothetical protein